ncbi:hypothetical protein U1Q18_019675 [Sarracenia purpurea var. burkii]
MYSSTSAPMLSDPIIAHDDSMVASVILLGLVPVLHNMSNASREACTDGKTSPRLQQQYLLAEVATRTLERRNFISFSSQIDSLSRRWRQWVEIMEFQETRLLWGISLNT